MGNSDIKIMTLPTFELFAFGHGKRIERGRIGKTTLSEVLTFANKHPEALVCYSTRSPWWCLLSEIPYRLWPYGIPCDPKGNVLLQAAIKSFIDAAMSKPGHYGKHSFEAFMAAYHMNLTNDDGSPAVLANWDEYNAALDVESVKADVKKLLSDRREP